MKRNVFLAVFLTSNLFLVAYAEDVATTIQRLKDKNTRDSAFEEIKKMDKTEISGELRKLAKDKNSQQAHRTVSIVLLGQIKDYDSEKDIVEILNTEDNYIMKNACLISLGHMGKKDLIPLIKSHLNDEPKTVSLRSAWALAKLGDFSGKGIAINTLLQDTIVTHKAIASEVIEQIGDKSIIDELKTFKNNSNDWTQIYINLTIAKLQISGLSKEEQINILKNTISDNQFEIRKWAADKLDEIGTPEAMKTLEDIAKDRDNKGSYVAGKILFNKEQKEKQKIK
ncbi:MAG: hypothetical protein A2252_07340 [Elusimicrobia bacterium RIFOXYA2_FULL_39_19]|nr:MAG: hypothetical protein A2252_07340 [Elusimicrobia bacterium RIFOXYA2_FULL_39_19]